MQLVVWPQDSVCDRRWLLENVQGAVGLLVMLTDKVTRTKEHLLIQWLRTANPTKKQVDEELLTKGFFVFFF